MSGLVDQYNRPISSKVAMRALSEEVALPTLSGVRRTIDDAVAAGITPEGLSRILVRAANGDARAYLTLAEEMEERYQHYASQLQTRRLAIEGVSVSIDAPDGVAPKILDAVTGLVETPRFEQASAELTDGIAKGYAVVEMMWDYQAGFLRPVEFKYRDPRFFVFDRLSLSELRLAVDTSFDGELLQPFKFIRHLPRAKMGIPLRRGLARPAGFAFLVQQFGLQSWASFAEIYGVPFRLGKYHSAASDTDKRALLTAVRMIAQDAAAICPTGMEIEFHKVEGQHGADVFGELIDYVDKQVSKLVVGQTMTSDDGASMAQAKVHNEVRLDILRADCKQLAQTLNRDVVEPFVIMNFGPQDAYPQVALNVAEPEDTVALSDALAKLVPLGLRVGQKGIREKLGISEPSTDDELLGPPKAADDGADRPAGAKAIHPKTKIPDRQDRSRDGNGSPTSPAALAAGLRGHVTGCRCGGCLNRPARLAADPTAAIDAPDEVDQLVEEIIDREWEAIDAGLVGPLREILDTATSLEEAREMLAARGPDASRLIESLARGTAIARGIGDVRD
ncbi:DUF935 domain-containing protein [Methylopila sp. M107]|uniref:DUF935 domain-containing protein n=1 Tax=Methylopila sp. M107 TaxID=1101190 RepID=UPI00035E8CC4|nr:DUF935 domain-containing protein [Methylopila sp. M107]